MSTVMAEWLQVLAYDDRERETDVSVSVPLAAAKTLWEGSSSGRRKEREEKATSGEDGGEREPIVKREAGDWEVMDTTSKVVSESDEEMVIEVVKIVAEDSAG